VGEDLGTAVVMVSGVDDTRVAALALDLGAYGYVIKPFEANELIITVANALIRRRLEIADRAHRDGLETLVLQRTDRLQEVAESLEESERTYRLLFDANPVPMWVYDQESLAFLAVNDAAVVHYGYSRDEFTAMTVRDIRPPEDGAALTASIAGAKTLDHSGPWRHLLKDGTAIDVEITSHPLIWDGHPARFAMASDITARLAQDVELRHLAVHDVLTGLANRTMVLDRLERALARAKRSPAPIAVLVVDLDRFKVVNDAHGREVGDELLQDVGRRLVTAAGDSGTVGRLGADEFVVVCEGVIDEMDASVTAEWIMAAIGDPFPVGRGELYITASVGIALSGPDSRPDELLRDAAAAVNRAKERGGARHELFDERIRGWSLVRLETEGALRRAMERAELRLFYQPELDLRTGACVGVEALMRWQHPTRGLLQPCEFIPLAEETGLIIRLGRWALMETCRQAAAWRQAGVQVGTVSVNLSARQFSRPDLVSDVRDALTRSRLDPAGLCLELTESALMEDADAAVAVLQELRAIGVRLSIDDFGTGYSSLLYLRRYPVDFIKVDRTFVAGLDDDAHDEAIVSGVIGLGHAFGLEVVAEGVETANQAAILRRMGCDIGQGYLWSPAVPPDELVAVLGAIVPASTVAR
jgi:diguanylate cyclase (GGDEF)-like protein/PAS domain S-box-containing protein